LFFLGNKVEFWQMTLEEIGWNAEFAKEFKPYTAKGWQPARLIRDNKITYGALLEGGDELEVIMSGKVYHDAENDAALPAVGDWVAIDEGKDNEEPVIRARLERQSCFSRKLPGKSSEEQVMAANVNVVVVVTDAGADYNPRRLERYFMLIEKSGAKAVVLVNKSDLLTPEINEEARREISELNEEADVYVTSAKRDEGLEVLKTYLQKGVSITLVGSSGVGKSTLGTDETTLRDSFVDIEKLAESCKFHDCKHGMDKGCAIRSGVEDGSLDAERYESFLKLEEEIEELKRRQKKRQMLVERRAKRDNRVKARNLADRIDYQKEQNPERF